MSKYRNVIGLVLILLLGPTLLTNRVSIPSLPAVHGATHNILLDGRLSGWNSTTLSNPTISVAEDDSVSLTLSSGDGVTHQFYIDVNRNGFAEGAHCNDSLLGTDKCSLVFPPSRNYNFTVDFAPGTYTYYCWYHPGAMFGSFIVQGFTITSNPANLAIAPGSSDTSSITLTSVGGFSGTATFTTSVSPMGPNLSLNPPSVTLPPGGTATSVITVDIPPSTIPNAYNVQVNATIGSTVRETSLVINVLGKDFAISASPTSLTISVGSTTTSTITLRSSNNFSGNITLTANPSPNGLAQAFSMTPVRLTAGATATSILTVSSPSGAVSGNYTVIVYATNGTLTHMTSLSITVTDFGLTSHPDSITIIQGSMGTVTVTITSFNGFYGEVSLTTSSSSPNVVSSVSPATVNLVARGSGTATLTISAGNNGPYNPAAPGTSNVTVTASSGQTLHMLKVRVVLSSSSSSPSLPISIGVIVALIAAVVVGALFMRQRRTRSARLRQGD